MSLQRLEGAQCKPYCPGWRQACGAKVTCEKEYLPVGGSSTNDAQTNIMTCSKDSDVVSCVSDFDGDGLSDAVETNTGKYLTSTDTGTNPKNVDTDNDTLPMVLVIPVYSLTAMIPELILTTPTQTVMALPMVLKLLVPLILMMKIVHVGGAKPVIHNVFFVFGFLWDSVEELLRWH